MPLPGQWLSTSDYLTGGTGLGNPPRPRPPCSSQRTENPVKVWKRRFQQDHGGPQRSAGWSSSRLQLCPGKNQDGPELGAPRRRSCGRQAGDAAAAAAASPGQRRAPGARPGGRQVSDGRDAGSRGGGPGPGGPSGPMGAPGRAEGPRAWRRPGPGPRVRMEAELARGMGREAKGEEKEVRAVWEASSSRVRGRPRGRSRQAATPRTAARGGPGSRSGRVPYPACC